MRETVYGYPLVDVITILEMHGYEVRHKTEGKRVVQFGRTHPLPGGEERFKAEALESIRRQITLEDLKFTTDKVRDMAPGLPDTITTAKLRIF
jgi:hypothetical protein